MSSQIPTGSLSVSMIIQKYAMPALIGVLNGKTEAQFHQYMKTKPDFITEFQRRHPNAWNIMLTMAPKYRGTIHLDPRTEASRICWVIHSKGWKVYKSEFLHFQFTIARLLSLLQ